MLKLSLGVKLGICAKTISVGDGDKETISAGDEETVGDGDIGVSVEDGVGVTGVVVDNYVFSLNLIAFVVAKIYLDGFTVFN